MRVGYNPNKDKILTRVMPEYIKKDSKETTNRTMGNESISQRTKASTVKDLMCKLIKIQNF